MSDKLDTAAKVKAWITDVTWLRGYHAREEGPSGQIERRAREAAYDATAEYLAKCVRVTEIVERDRKAAHDRNLGPYSSDRILENFATCILVEAAQKGDK